MANKLGELLVTEQTITAAQLQEALQSQKESDEYLGAILISQGHLTEEQLMEALVRQPGIQQADLSRASLDPSLASMIPEKTARRRKCVPVHKSGAVLQVGFVDPLDDKAIDFLGQMTQLTIQVCAITTTDFETAMQAVYSAGGATEAQPGTPSASGQAADTVVGNAIQELADDDLEDDDDELPEDSAAFSDSASEAPVVRIVNGLILKAMEIGSSDIHIEPQEKTLRVRCRVDGVLHTVFTLPPHIKNSLTGRIKVMSKMDVAEHRIPQDGRIKLFLDKRQSIDLRVNTLPGVLGEKIVMRLLGTGQLRGRVADLGFAPENLEDVEKAVLGHFGMILVTGPTGSGKSTSLYTMLNQLNTEGINIVTAEDPVEYNLPGIHQVAVRPHIGFTFDTALRSFLRQDPDVILVGEMRDYETASIAIKAALTGHLVLSTLHTNDAPSTVVRLVDMGIEPYLVASAVKLVISQRLVRKICENCKEEQPIDDAQKTDLSESVLDAIEAIFRGRGCEQCNQIGHKGRLPIFEVMPIRSREMRRVITEGGTEVQVCHVAVKEGLRTLKDAALRLVNTGIISLEEGIKVALAD